jgi:hypothetical protein
MNLKTPLLDADAVLSNATAELSMPSLNDLDAEIFSLLSKDRRLQDEIVQARKNN